MARRKLTEEELERLRKIKEANQAIEDSILFKTEALNPAQAKARDKKKEQEIIDLVGGGQVSVYSRKQFNKMLLKKPTYRDVTFEEEFYNQLYRLTGLKRSKDKPHEKPHVFAFYTVKYIYGRFMIKNLMTELWERNPFLTGELFREFKHYQLLNDENYKKLIGFIESAIEFMIECKDMAMFEFDVKYCKKYGIKTDEDLFYKGE